MAVVHARHGNSLTTIDLSDTSSMAIPEPYQLTYLDGTPNCLDEANAIAYTQGYDSDSFAAVSYSDRANPVVLGGISGDSTYMNGASDVCNLDSSVCDWEITTHRCDRRGGSIQPLARRRHH